MAAIEALDIIDAPKELSQKDQALENVRKICDGLRGDLGSIFIGMTFHPVLKNQIEKCDRLGISRGAIEKITQNYRQHY